MKRNKIEKRSKKIKEAKEFFLEKLYSLRLLDSNL